MAALRPVSKVKQVREAEVKSAGNAMSAVTAAVEIGDREIAVETVAVETVAGEIVVDVVITVADAVVIAETVAIVGREGIAAGAATVEASAVIAAGTGAEIVVTAEIAAAIEAETADGKCRTRVNPQKTQILQGEPKGSPLFWQED